MSGRIVIGLNAVILAVTDEEPRVLIVDAASIGTGETGMALPFGPLDPERDRTLELALRGWVHGQTGLELGYVEQLYTFADRFRDPREREGGPRVVSIGYLSLLREEQTADEAARWRSWYDFLPWEDWRNGRPRILDERIEPALRAWAARGAREERVRRGERLDIAFGWAGAQWDGNRVLSRYELLYEAGLVEEAWRDQGSEPPGDVPRLGASWSGRAMAFDHRRMLATAVGRVRGKIRYRPVVFELVAPTFTLLQLQRVVEALAGMPLHKQNFRRLVEKGGLVEGTGKLSTGAAGRPAEIFRFRREVLRERPAPGVGLPGLPRS